MRRVVGFACVLLLSCCSSAPDFKLPVAKIDVWVQRVMEVMRNADADKNGVIEGAELYLLGTIAVNAAIEVATELAQKAAAEANKT